MRQQGKIGNKQKISKNCTTFTNCITDKHTLWFQYMLKYNIVIITVFFKLFKNIQKFMAMLQRSAKCYYNIFLIV